MKTIAMWWRSATSMAISSRTRAAGLDDRRDAALGGELDRVGEREVGVGREHAPRRPVGGPVERDLDRRQPAGLPGADAHERAVPREHDRVARHVADRAPREQQVGELLERRPAAGHDVELRPVDLELVARLDQQPALDAVEVEVRDAVVGQPVGALGRHRQDREVVALGEHRQRRVAEARRHDGLVGVER